MKRITVFLLLLVLLAASLPIHVHAQDAADEGCTADDVAAYLDDLEAATASARVALESVDPASALAELAEITTAYYALQSACLGLTFEGDSGQVIGPVEFPQGMYRATMTAGGSINSDVEVIEGECGYTNYMGFMIMSMSGQASSELVFKSSGCTALITVEAILPVSWSLTFEKLN